MYSEVQILNMKGCQIVNFEDYAKGLQPYISQGKTDADFFVSIIGNFIKDAAMDSCKLLTYKPDTQYRYVNGSPIQKKDAQFLYDNRDMDKYSQWVSESMDNSDSYEAVENWLTTNGMDGIYADDECAQLLESIILSICSDKSAQKKTPLQFEESLNLIKDINEKIRNLPHPTPVPVPAIATDTERVYVNELFAAYGDAESIVPFAEEDLLRFPDYKDDLDDRRVDYYSAVSVERGVMELNADNLSNQFDILKEETLDGVKDTAKKQYSNAYDKMLSVMEKVTSLSVDNYLLSKSPFWISGKIKKGVCHHLVNDGKLKWVKKK